MARGIPVPAVIPEASKAFILCVPDDAFFYSVVMGAIKTMTFRYYWQGTREQIDAVTERMLTMYYHYQEQTGCMICELVIDCLENDEATKEALRSIIRGMTTNPATDPYGQNVPESELTRDVAAGTNPTCNLDILWSQCLNVVKVTNLAIVDVLQKFEVSTNIAELVNGLIDVVPILGSAKQIIGASGALDLMNYFQESFSEGYLAQYTETPGGVQDQIACDLFCACQVDCQITIQRVEEVMRARLAEHIEVVTVTDFVDLVETIAGIEPDTTYVVDLAFWFGWVAVRTGNFLFGQTFNGGLDLIVALAADEPSNDWELLCDCPDCGIEYTIVIGSEDVPPDIVSAATALVDRLDITGTAYGRRIELTFAEPVTSITFGWNTEGAADDMYAKLGTNDTEVLAAPAGSMTLTGAASATFIVDLGYSGDSGAYAANPARITITNACT